MALFSIPSWQTSSAEETSNTEQNQQNATKSLMEKENAVLCQVAGDAPSLQSDDNPRFGCKGRVSPELAEAMGCSVSERQLYFTKRSTVLELAKQHFNLGTKGWKERPEGAENEMLADLAIHFPNVYGETVSDLDRERRFGVLCKYIQRYKYTNLKSVARSGSKRGFRRGHAPGRGPPRSNRTRPDGPESVPLLLYPSDDQKPVEDAEKSSEGNKASSVEPVPLSSFKSPEDISQFLQGCNPPLTHLIEPLLAAGCVNKVLLSAMASWEAPEIMDFLKVEVTLESGQRIPPLEARILARQLKIMALSSVDAA